MDRPHTSKAPGRKIYLAALVGSLLIHLGLAGLVLHVTKPVVFKSQSPGETEIEVQESEAPWAAKTPAPTPSSKPGAAQRALSVRRTSRGHLASSSIAKGSLAKGSLAKSWPAKGAVRPALAGGPAYAGDVPAAFDLSLHAHLETASPGGETVHNRPGEVEPEGARGSVAQARINQWIDEDTATRRVDKGQVDDWFARLDTSMDRALNSAGVPADLPSAVGGLLTKRGGLRNYGADAASYGATGTPGEPSPAPPVTGPGADFGPVAQALGPPARIQIQVDSSGLDPWTVVELRFDLGGKLRDSRVVDSSGNRVFNVHVLHVLALGLPGLPEAPDGGFGIHPDGTRSVWRVKGHLSYDHTSLSPNDIWYLPIATAVSMYTGANLDDFVGHVTGRPHLDVKVELLQVY